MLVLSGCDLKPGATTITEALQGSGPTPFESAQMARDQYDASARYRGTLALANENFAGDPIYIKLFELNLADKDPSVRMASIRGLANHGEPRHVELIIPFLKDEAKLVRIEAARALQRLHDDSAVEPLLAVMRAPEPDPRTRKMVGETEPEVRSEAATALGQYDEPKVVRQLIFALDDTDLTVNRNAQASLKVLTGQDFGLEKDAWTTWMDKFSDPQAMFLGRSLYIYPVYNRKKRIYEYLPFVPRPPNEVAAPPAGMPR